MEGIIQLPLFRNKKTGGSYLGKPAIENDPELEFQYFIYVISPDFRPVPYGTEMFLVKTTEKSISSIQEFYDPFNQDEPGMKFLAWNDPAPFTTPLYIYKRGNVIFLSIEKLGEPEVLFSPIHILTDPKLGFFRTIPVEKKGEEFKFGVGTDFGFRFSGYKGRCLPDPGGESLQSCVSRGIPKGKQPLFLNDLVKRKRGWDFEIIFIVLILLFGVGILFWRMERNAL